MVRLNSPKRVLFTPEDFEEYPIWTWDDAHESYLPISERDPSIEDYDILFIKSKFETNGYSFDGYLTGDISFYAFGIFIDGKLFSMNLGLHSLVRQRLNEIFLVLRCEPFDFFPVYYYSPIHLKERKEISGYLNLYRRYK